MVGSEGEATGERVSRPLILRPEAEEDVAAAYHWYEEEPRPGSGVPAGRGSGLGFHRAESGRLPGTLLS